MLLPDKHIRVAESILGLSSLVLAHMRKPRTFDSLMAALSPKFETSAWPAYHTTETVCLALCFLFSVGLIDVSPDGELYRCDSSN